MKLSKQFQLYESEATQFLNTLKKDNPKLEETQKQGRDLLWDKGPIDLDTSRRNSESKVPQSPYVYQNSH
jgi:hypothetical protein